MKSIIKLFVPLLLLAGCTKDISGYNSETKRATSVPAALLFSNAVRNVADGLASPSVNTNVFRFVVKHWAMATYQDEAQYDFNTRGIPDAWWARMYRDALNDLKDAARVASADPLLTEGQRTNQLAIIDLTEVYVYSILVNTYGDVPYSQALSDSIPFPNYDDAAAIYTDLLSRISADVSALNTADAGFSATQDLLGGGDIEKWIRFGNSLQIRLGMTLADVNNTAAQAAVEAGADMPIDDAAYNMGVYYQATSPNTNPLFTDIVLGGRNDYLAAKDLMDPLKAMSDPRKSHYFGTNNDGEYEGGIVGEVNTASETSKPSSQVSAASAPYLFLDNVETEFYLAEAVERGYDVTGTAAEHYEKAIRASILYWGGTDAEATTYLARPDVAYATAAGDWKQKIGFQKWIALYNRPFEGWTELRRLDYPKIGVSVGAISGFPNRLPYPANEQQTNGGSYTKAAAAIGGDEVETKLFWDVY